jgi:hypothetical protein
MNNTIVAPLFLRLSTINLYRHTHASVNQSYSSYFLIRTTIQGSTITSHPNIIVITSHYSELFFVLCHYNLYCTPLPVTFAINMISTMKSLLKLQVLWINSILQEAYLRSDDPEHRADIARAALANLTWHGMLSTMEETLPQQTDVHLVAPED